MCSSNVQQVWEGLTWSDDETAGSSIPPGYYAARSLHYPTVATNVAALGLLLVLTPMLSFGVWFLHRSTVTHGEYPIGLVEVLVALSALLLTIVMHEWLHALATQAYGYQTQFVLNWRRLLIGICTPAQMQQRNHALLATLAPLVCISLPALALSLTPMHSLIAAGTVALLTNLVSSAGDLWLAWALLGLPDDALVYEIDAEHALIFEPVMTQL
jgi:hypothetical protein